MMRLLEKLDMKLLDPVTDWRQRIFRKAGIKIIKGQKVLDTGCGDGGDALIFAKLGANVIGTDIKPHANWQIWEQDNLKFRVADACDLPFDDDSFDLVFEKDMLHHVSNPKKALSEIRRVAKRKGQIIAIEASRYNPILYLHMTLIKGHSHITKRYFRILMKDYFKNVKFKTIESHVYPIRHYSIIKIVHLIEDFLEKVPIISEFLSYNIAIAYKNEY